MRSRLIQSLGCGKDSFEGIPILTGNRDTGVIGIKRVRGDVFDSPCIDQISPMDTKEAAAEDGFPMRDRGLVAVGGPVGQMDIDLGVAGFDIQDPVDRDRDLLAVRDEIDGRFLFRQPSRRGPVQEQSPRISGTQEDDGQDRIVKEDGR